MLKRIVHSVFAVTMSLLLVFGNVSKQYLHSFSGHEDTVHCDHHDSEGLFIDNEHHHCDFLSFALPPFINDIAVYHFSVSYSYPRTYNVTLAEPVSLRDVHVVCLRGPPVV